MNFYRGLAFFVFFLGNNELFQRLDKTPTNHVLRYVVSIGGAVLISYAFRAIERRQKKNL